MKLDNIPGSDEVRMKQICAAPIGDGRNALFGLDANGVVYQYVYQANGLKHEYRWEALRMSTKFGDPSK